MNARIFIGLGSNLGDRLKFLQRAIDAVMQLPSTTLQKASSVYETEPVGKKNQPLFLNAVVELRSTFTPVQLFSALKDIEHQLGRTRTERWGPREIDVDLLYYGSTIYKESGLEVPHPEIQNRKFVLVPLAEICGNFTDPVVNRPVNELLKMCRDRSELRKLSDALHHLPEES